MVSDTVPNFAFLTQPATLCYPHPPPTTRAAPTNVSSRAVTLQQWFSSTGTSAPGLCATSSGVTKDRHSVVCHRRKGPEKEALANFVFHNFFWEPNSCLFKIRKRDVSAFCVSIPHDNKKSEINTNLSAIRSACTFVVSQGIHQQQSCEGPMKDSE